MNPKFPDSVRFRLYFTGLSLFRNKKPYEIKFHKPQQTLSTYIHALHCLIRKFTEALLLHRRSHQSCEDILTEEEFAQVMDDIAEEDNNQLRPPSPVQSSSRANSYPDLTERQTSLGEYILSGLPSGIVVVDCLQIFSSPISTLVLVSW